MEFFFIFVGCAALFCCGMSCYCVSRGLGLRRPGWCSPLCLGIFVAGIGDSSWLLRSLFSFSLVQFESLVWPALRDPYLLHG